MTTLYIYLSGLVAYILVAGLFGRETDDTAVVAQALIWPVSAALALGTWILVGLGALHWKLRQGRGR